MVDNAIKEKRRLWKKWKAGGSNEIYLEAKCEARSEVWTDNKHAGEERFTNILRRDDEKGDIHKIAKQMARTKQDVIGEKCTRNDHSDLAFDDCAKDSILVLQFR